MAVKEQCINDRFAIYNGDCCEVLPELPAASVDLSMYSPPFADLYNYSSSDADMSNCRSYEQFFEHYGYLVRQIERVTKPGRLSVVHCMDLKAQNRAGVAAGTGQTDFPGDIIRLHEQHGFIYAGRITIWKEPLRVAIRTRALGLMHKQIVKDSTLCRPAGADYIVLFRKRGANAVPVAHPQGLCSYAGGREVPPALLHRYGAGWPDPRTNKLSHWIWQQYASCVWMDIRVGHVLPYKGARDAEDEKHVCPLQLDVIERLVILYSNPGETVLTPFLGVGSEIYGAVINNRRGIGIELKPSYYRQAKRNIEAAADGSWRMTPPQAELDMEEDRTEYLEDDAEPEADDTE